MQNNPPIPSAFLEVVAPLLGEELPSFLSALDQPSTRAARVNRLRGEALRHCAPFLDEVVPWCTVGYYLKEGARPGATIAHELGAMYLQEASAMTAARVLDARPGERILDLCAAPGGKSGQIAADLNGQGLLIANEIVPSRAKLLKENLERLGAWNAVAVNASPDALAKRWEEAFDAVLVDAPCSGEGMFRREPAARAEWSPDAPKGCARRQAEILDSAARLVRPGGRLVYSTCTFNQTEDEGSVEAFLLRHGDFAPEDFSLPGLGKSKDGMLRVWPHRVRGDGHFVAKLIKRGDGGKSCETVERDGTLQPFLALLKDEVCLPPDGVLIRQGDYVHLLPYGTPSLKDVRVVKPGLELMRVGRSHIQPLYALARVMEIDEALTDRIRRGEKPKLTGANPGWTLLTWEGLPVAYWKIGRED